VTDNQARRPHLHLSTTPPMGFTTIPDKNIL
jgi:hypothetical protein